MIIYINSERREIPDDINNVSRLVAFLRLKKEGLGVGVNSKLIPTRNWETASIKEDDRIIIVSAAYGG